MAEDQDDSQKTEEPTRKRLEDAQERGQVITSREASSFFLLLAFTLVFSWMAPSLFRKTQLSFAGFIEHPDTIPVDQQGLAILLPEIVKMSAMILGIPFMAFMAAVILASIMQNRFVFSFEPIIPKLEKISVLKGVNRLFSMRAVIEFLKGLIKIIVVGTVAYIAVAPYFTHLKLLPQTSISGILAFLMTSAKRMLIGVCIVMFFIAIFDYLYQRYEYIKGLRMTKQEIKDEYKQQEGDPKIKQKLRQIRMERARRRMIAAVPTADVIITNPTHYSIALKYDSDKMQAPRLVAKGLDNIALKIREVAREHSIPIVENPPLAQALYAAVDIDEEIPTEHYKAVAEIISYVYRLQGKIKN